METFSWLDWLFVDSIYTALDHTNPDVRHSHRWWWKLENYAQGAD